MMAAFVKAFILLLAAVYPRVAHAQAAAQFVPNNLASNITSRLVFRQEGLANFWRDPATKSVVVRDRVVLNPDFWRGQFQDTGGVAVLSKTSNRPVFTITSEYPCLTNSCYPADNASQVTPELNFSLMANAMLVDNGAHLAFHDILLSDFAHVAMYQYTTAQPYINQGIGWPLWPTVAMAPDSQVDVINVSAAYQNPSAVDTCEQYTQRAVYALRQQYGNNVTAYNSTSIQYQGPLKIQVLVNNGSDNSTLGTAAATIRNVTFHCVPRIYVSPAAGSGLTAGSLAAAIVVPVVIALAAAAGAWYCIRKRRQHRQAADSKNPDMIMDVEMGQGGRGPDVAGGHWDQQVQGVDKVPELPGHCGPGYYHTSSSSAATSSVSVAPHTWSGSAPPSGGVAMPGFSNTPPYSYPAASGSTVTVPATPTTMSLPPHGPLLAGMSASGLQTGSSQQYSSRQHSGSGGTGSQVGVRYSSSWQEHASNALQYPATGGQEYLERRSLLSDGVVSAGRVSQGASAGSQGGSADGSQGRLSGGGGAKMPTGGSGGSGARGTGGSGNVASDGSSSQALSSGSTAFGRSSGGVPALLKARSDMAVLRDLKIGPLLGRGSYGRVYKGRWKAVTVAVKIIEHMEGAPGTASSGGKKISIGREAQLATSIAHPNVVQTYQISTMTVSQRNALARTWMEEGNHNNNSNLNQLPSTADAAEGGENDSSSSNDGNDEPQKDVLETWMIMEFCEKGSLDRALVRKRFIRKEDGMPEMIGIYKALLDTASGLDYLHSIGVVHGDLKTANVLLKGSTRDVRGFACKITDFGLSRVLDLDATHISTRTYGTIVYMPAELLLTGRMTQSTDVYSFGLMMWELYTSSRIFNEGLSVGQIFYMIAYQGWRPEIPPGCPPGYAALMAACWHQNPEQRPTAQYVLKTLQKLYVQEKQAAAAVKEAMTAAKEAAAAAAAAVAPSPSGAAGAPPHGSGEQQRGSDTSVHTGDGGSASSGGLRACLAGAGSSGGTPQRGSGNDKDIAAAGAAAGRHARVSAGSSGAAGPAGSGGQATGSGGSGPQEGGGLEQQYQPWAQAVSSRVGKQLQEDRQEEQPPQQYLTPRRNGWPQRAGPLQSVNEHTPVTGAMDTPGITGGYVPPQQDSRYAAMEMQTGEDDGPPSELLYQNDSLISNIAPDDDAEDLDGPRVARYNADAQIAAGYLDAVQTASRQGPVAGVTTASGLPGLTHHGQQTPFQYQQQQRPQPGHRPLPGAPALQGSQGLSVSSSTLGGGWGSVSTGTMPSALGGNSSLNLSLMASQSVTSPTLGTGATAGPGGSSSTSSGGSRLQQQPAPQRAVASPFAALAQRAGSLFGPLVKH